MIVDILTGLIRANLAAAAAILVVTMIRRPVRRAFGARAAYALWIAPVLIAFAGLAPQPAASTLAETVVLQAGAAAARSVQAGLTGAPDISAGLLAVWLAGAAAAGGLLFARQSRFLAAMGHLTPVGSGQFRAQRADVGPAVVGALRPRIVTPADFEARFAPDERAVILAHEAHHLATGDARINALAAALQCLAWFNPLAHLAVHLMRIDQELACDAAVLARFPDARRLYAEVLLKAQLVTQPLPLGCHWPAGSEHPLKERIAMLKSPLPAPARRAAGLALVAAVSLGGACAAWAAQAPALGVITHPVWIKKPDGQDLQRVWPAASKDQGGRATMTCRVDGEGLLQKCAVISEAPAAAGFGPAVLQLAASFQMEARTGDGEPVRGREVRIPVRFSPPSN
jgi:TonB family protein